MSAIKWVDLRTAAIEKLEEDYGPFNMCFECERWLPEAWMTMVEHISSVSFYCEACHGAS